MKTAKEYPNLERVYYRPEFEACLNCGGDLKRSHTRWCKIIQFLSGPQHIFNQAYRCECASCRESSPLVYSSVYANGLSLPYRTYGLEVVVHIGQQRLREHQTIPEIHDGLVTNYHLQISERQVLNLFDEYLVLSACSQDQRLTKYQPTIKANGGIVLAIDAARPEKGQPGLYIFRDALSGLRLHSAVLQSADQDTLSQELQIIKALDLEVQAVVSDDEKAIVAAVARTLPDVPHGLCHIHFLKAVQTPIHQQDQKLARALKQPLRDLNKVERVVKNEPAVTDELDTSQQQALRRYMDALRGILLTKGQAPLRLAGTVIYEALNRLAASLERSGDAHEHPLLDQLQQMAATYEQQHDVYEHVLEQQAWFLGLAELLNVPLTETLAWSTSTGAEVAQDVDDYLDDLDALKDDLPEHAALFDHMRRRRDEWAPGLFWTYDIHPLPRTNNALEADIGDIKAQYRRITGHRTLKDYLMRYGPYLTFDDDNDDPAELLLWFQEVDYALYQSEKAKLDALRAQLRNIHRFRTNPDDFLAQTERLWANSS